MRFFKLAPIGFPSTSRNLSTFQPTRQTFFNSMATPTCRALIIRQRGSKNTLAIETIPLPQPGPHQVLVKVAVAAQNPTDVACFDKRIFGDGSILGCDFAGTVAAVGSEVARIQQGDKIAGLIWGGKRRAIYMARARQGFQVNTVNRSNEGPRSL